jgi:homoaconitate hydratase
MCVRALALYSVYNNRSIQTGITATVDFAKATVTAGDKTYAISPVGTAAQELVLTGGLENWVKKRLT